MYDNKPEQMIDNSLQLLLTILILIVCIDCVWADGFSSFQEGR